MCACIIAYFYRIFNWRGYIGLGMGREGVAWRRRGRGAPFAAWSGLSAALRARTRVGPRSAAPFPRSGAHGGEGTRGGAGRGAAAGSGAVRGSGAEPRARGRSRREPPPREPRAQRTPSPRPGRAARVGRSAVPAVGEALGSGGS